MVDRKSKADLVSAIAAEVGGTKVAVGQILDSALDIIQQWVSAEQEVSLIGFGTFGVSKRAERNGRNPQTGAMMKIRATKLPKFKAGKGFKDLVNEQEK